MVSAYNDSPPQNPALYCHVSMHLLMSENRKTIIYCYFRRSASNKLGELLQDWGRNHSAKTFERPKENCKRAMRLTCTLLVSEFISCLFGWFFS